MLLNCRFTFNTRTVARWRHRLYTPWCISQTDTWQRCLQLHRRLLACHHIYFYPSKHRM